MSQIIKFSIRGYRSFKTTQTLEFATYHQKEGRSGITYLVGENNSGKTSLLEALRVGDTENAQNNTLSTNEAKNSFLLQLYSDDKPPRILRRVELLNPNWYTTKNVKNELNLNAFSFIPSRRYWHPSVDMYQSDIEGARQNASNNLTLRYKMENNQFPQVASILHAIIGDPNQKQYKEVIELIRRVFPSFNSFKVVNDGRLQIVYEANGIKHRTDMLGDGVVSVMAIAAFLVKKTSKILVIDEPELSLHPLAQKRLADVLLDYSYTQQIIISTHSPYFINTESFKKGAVLNRVTKINDRESKLYHTQPWEVYKNLLGGSDYQKPRIFDSVAKEIFFEDNILFVEGQDDRSLLDSVGVLDDNINIFGYGVGGKDNFVLALTLASDIGIKKAAVLIDGGSDENDVVIKLEAMGLAHYKIIQWDKNDIRDKAAVKSKKAFTDGYFSKNGKLKDVKSDFSDKVADLNAYFSSEL